MPHLIYQKRDGIAYLTMNRPEKRNAITPEMVIQLAEAWTDFRDDGDARVAILTGAGDRAFCAGADLGRLIPLMTGARQPDDDWDERLLADPSIVQAALLREFDVVPEITEVDGSSVACEFGVP